MQQKDIFSAKEQENPGSIQVCFSLLGQVRTELVGLVKNIKLHFPGSLQTSIVSAFVSDESKANMLSNFFWLSPNRISEHKRYFSFPNDPWKRQIRRLREIRWFRRFACQPSHPTKAQGSKLPTRLSWSSKEIKRPGPNLIKKFSVDLRYAGILALWLAKNGHVALISQYECSKFSIA